MPNTLRDGFQMIHVSMPPDDIAWFKDHCKKKGVSMSDQMRRLIHAEKEQMATPEGVRLGMTAAIATQTNRAARSMYGVINRLMDINPSLVAPSPLVWAQARTCAANIAGMAAHLLHATIKRDREPAEFAAELLPLVEENIKRISAYADGIAADAQAKGAVVAARVGALNGANWNDEWDRFMIPMITWMAKPPPAGMGLRSTDPRVAALLARRDSNEDIPDDLVVLTPAEKTAFKTWIAGGGK